MATKKETTEVAVEATKKRRTTKSSEEKSKAKKAPSLKRRVTAKKSVAEAPQVKILDRDQFEIQTIVEAMQDKKAKNVVSLDLRELGTSICDYFVICNADSTTNVLAIADNIEEEMIVKCDRKVARLQGKENAFWIILDYSNIVVHIFQTEYREFYRLEDLWADCKTTNYAEE